MSEGIQAWVKEQAGKSIASGYLMLAVATLAFSTIVLAITVGVIAFGAGKHHAYIAKVEPDGMAQMVGDGFQYTPQAQDLEWFVKRFCRIYFSRDRLTITELPSMLLYLSPDVMERVSSEWDGSKMIQSFLSNPNAAQVDAWVPDDGLHISRPNSDTYEAYVEVELDKSIDGHRTEPSKGTVYLRFRCLACEGKAIPDSIAESNPLGFQIENEPVLEGAR